VKALKKLGAAPDFFLMNSSMRIHIDKKIKAEARRPCVSIVLFSRNRFLRHPSGCVRSAALKRGRRDRLYCGTRRDCMT
jgi:hypothetical protein